MVKDFEEVKDNRREWDRRWYIAKRFLSGDHYVYYSRNAGKLIKLSSTPDKVRRSIDLSYAYRRSLKNTIVKDPTWSVIPTQWDESGEEEAKKANHVLRKYWDILRLKALCKEVVGNGLDCSKGYLYIDWDDNLDPKSKIGDMFAKTLSTFDVFFPLGYSSINDSPIVYVTSKHNVDDIRKNPAFKEFFEANPDAEIAPDGKVAASDYEAALNTERKQDAKTKILVDGYTRLMEPNSLGGYVNLTTFTLDKQILREVETPYSRYPIFEYAPEKETNEPYVTSWMERMIEVNKIIDKMASEVENYVIKFKPKYLIPKGSGVRKISSNNDIVEYNASFPRAVGTLTPPLLPSTPFDLIAISKGWMEDILGLHEASMGKIPSGVRAAKMLDALQMGDVQNVSDPVDNLQVMLNEVAEFIFELLTVHQVTEKELGYISGTKEMLKIASVNTYQASNEGEVAPEKPGGVFVIDKYKVQTSLTPAIAFSEFGKRQTLLDLFDRGALPVEELWKGFNFSNIPEIAEEMESQLNQRLQEANMNQAKGAQPVRNPEREVRP